MFFFFNDTATTEIYTLSLHDALPISGRADRERARQGCLRAAVDVRADQRQPDGAAGDDRRVEALLGGDRKSTRLNSSHTVISYAVFCLKKKKKKKHENEKETNYSEMK